MLHQYRSLEALEDARDRTGKRIGEILAMINRELSFGLRRYPPARILPAEAGGLEHSITRRMRKGQKLATANSTKTVMADRMVKQCDITVDGEAIGTLTIHTRKVQGSMKILNILYNGTIPGYEHPQTSGKICMQSTDDPPLKRDKLLGEAALCMYEMPNNTECEPLFRRDCHHELGLAAYEFLLKE